MGRDDAAAACGISRQTAAYHLDRLADDGLLDVEFRRLSGLSGPGAGRPAKLYRRSKRSISVSVPPRRYELAAKIMLEALVTDLALADYGARRIGEDLGRNGLSAALQGTGYEPTEEGGETRFRNCPFHVLKEQDRDTICGTNLALVEGMVEGAPRMERASRPRTGRRLLLCSAPLARLTTLQSVPGPWLGPIAGSTGPRRLATARNPKMSPRRRSRSLLAGTPPSGARTGPRR